MGTQQPVRTPQSSLEELLSGPLKGKIDPKTIIQYVNDNYDTWQKFIQQKFADKQFTARGPDGAEPIFDYNLLEALEEPDIRDAVLDGVLAGTEAPRRKAGPDSTEKLKKRDIKYPSRTFLKNTEIEYLKSKITQVISRKSFLVNDTKPQGFSLYDTRDEEGLHDGNTDYYYDEDVQDEYDIDEVDDGYDGPQEHHIELELKPECDIHGMDDCDCPIYESNEDELNEEASYNFTFEYNEEGKLVPASNDVEEKLRSLTLGAHESDPHGQSNRKKKKKKKKHQHDTRPVFDPDAEDSCLFCDFEAIYGHPPRQLIKWYNRQIEQEENRRQEIRKKLQTAKAKALKKQKELRAKQKQQRGGEEIDNDNVVEDEPSEAEAQSHI